MSKISVNYNSILGLAIARIRKDKGFTQAELAEKAGLLPTTLSRIEGGKIKIQVETLRALCDSLGVKIDFVFEEVDELTKKLEENDIDVPTDSLSKAQKNALTAGVLVLGGVALASIIKSFTDKK